MASVTKVSVSRLLKIQQQDLTADCLRINRNFDLIAGQLDQLFNNAGQAAAATTPSGGGGGGSGTTDDFLIDMLLSAPTTAIPSPQVPNNGQLITVILRQDATGGRRISWQPIFKAAPVDIDTSPNTISTTQFVGSGMFWVCCKTATSGITPSANIPSGTSHTSAQKILLDLGLAGSGVSVIPSPGIPINGQRFSVILRQTTGGTGVSWDASYSAAVDDVDTTVNTLSTFEFVGSANLWVMVGTPSTGIPYSSVPGSGAPVLGSATNLLLDQTLSSPSTVVVSPMVPVDAQRLSVILRQDGIGGRVASWDSNFDGEVAGIDTTPATLSAVCFVGTGGFWCMVGTPLTGAVP